MIQNIKIIFNETLSLLSKIPRRSKIFLVCLLMISSFLQCIVGFVIGLKAINVDEMAEILSSNTSELVDCMTTIEVCNQTIDAIAPQIQALFDLKKADVCD